MLSNVRRRQGRGFNPLSATRAERIQLTKCEGPYIEVSIHSPPRGRREYQRGRGCYQAVQFQSTLRHAGGENSAVREVDGIPLVSIHSPPRGRRESLPLVYVGVVCCFNPLSATRAERIIVRFAFRRGAGSFNPLSATRAERMRTASRWTTKPLFQSTLRHAGGENEKSEKAQTPEMVSIHSPPRGRREFR